MPSVRSAAAARVALDALERFGVRLDLARMQALMRALGDPQASLAAVHIVGTNGKSSTTRMSAAALAASGLRVGTYLSPHVLRIEERVQLDGVPLSSARFDRLAAAVLDAADGVADELGEGPTQFEALTAIAFLAFGEERLDAICVEAGLGGRLDATNVLDARVVGLTNVGLDHTAVLGDTPEQILKEKIAVVSPGAIVVLGELSEELARLGDGGREGARSAQGAPGGTGRSRGRRGPARRGLPAPERGARAGLCTRVPRADRARPGARAHGRRRGAAAGPSRAAPGPAARATGRRTQPARDARTRRRARCRARRPPPARCARRACRRTRMARASWTCWPRTWTA